MLCAVSSIDCHYHQVSLIKQVCAAKILLVIKHKNIIYVTSVTHSSCF